MWVLILLVVTALIMAGLAFNELPFATGCGGCVIYFIAVIVIILVLGSIF